MNRALSPVVSLLTCFASAAFVTADEPDAAIKHADNARQFTIECRVIDESGAKRSVSLCPRVTVFEHQRATITDQVKRPFVVAVAPRGDAFEPIIEVLPEGWTIEVACHACAGNKATLDVTLERSQITKVDVEALDAKTNVQRPQVALTKSRHFQTVRSGEPLTIPLDGKPLADSQLKVDLVVIDLGTGAK